ncbi:ABC transporter ATP-binding protein [[Mycoplasma] testudinis]|uniref:ABC transporter ATP-binding protein n=1 Tax=[Mycoplasma] testudinis TaxID=33924 RepID=UPI00069857E0|nr:ABC transporter ATP-binding protein [[Mycoplasma] testudinis]
MTDTNIKENSTIHLEKKKDNNILLSVKNLKVSFKIRRKTFINIIRGVDLKIARSQIVGVVGESGSGKSVMSKTLLNINENAIYGADKMELDGIDLTKLKHDRQWQNIRGLKVGYVPQDPLTSLNPTRKIKNQMLDSLNQNKEWKKKPLNEKKEYLIGLLNNFGIRNARNVFEYYPEALSGGMKQRVVIAMVIALRPSLIIADEPTTALDPTVQASVLALFEQIRQEMGISIILISHNISVVAKFCDYIYVMYAGRIVERGTKYDIFAEPAHPYTWALISAIPENREDRLYSIKGTPPDMANLPLGDPFALRSDYALEIDFEKEPPMIDISKTHAAATWLLHPSAPKVELSETLKRRLTEFKKVFSDESNK